MYKRVLFVQNNLNLSRMTETGILLGYKSWYEMDNDINDLLFAFVKYQIAVFSLFTSCFDFPNTVVLEIP